ncbi:DNA ligase (ATP) [Zalaria obscura]|uniref:DNA ligase (ATP) n=1 Tax=Zalaria obscura TaxID=2024903 RepID=A0ACC3SNG4_9PEZI
MADDSEMRDAAAVEEEEMQYGHGPMTEEDLDEKYPNRPHNHSRTLPFHDLFLTLFNPLNENKKKPTGPITARKKQGPHGPANLSPNEVRRSILERFISRWRKEVGNDIYPAFRLIVPEKDRDRGMYGLKEKTIGKLLVRVMKIDKNSEDGYNLLNWKLPGVKSSSAMAGDFAGRCYEVISKRPMRTTVGSLTIGEVNEMLDRLSTAQKEENQLPIFEEFYKRMNAEEMMWLIRMILRQMKVGATEKTIFDIWHPDAENLFNVSSSLRRVCWELYDPQIRLEGVDKGINLMQCFQPQLAAFQMHSMEKMVARMNPTEDDPVFWIEEKLDGERMQLHMIEDESMPGGRRFGFWSRKAKDYTYLYGNGFQDENAALTRHIKTAFDDGVRNIILDGEMITWDPEQDAMVPFGTLKTAALSEQRNPFSTGNRPMYRIFDCLYLNDRNLTNYTLRDRRRALEKSINSIHRRLENHAYTEATSAAEIEPLLRQVVAESSEGLVLKNPRSVYRLNERNDDWMKVKPEYMTEFGESLDCVVVGGYYGSGKRGGKLSSFLCGLRVDKNQIQQGANPMKTYSFFKVGGGFSAADYAEIRHRTDGKWVEWDPKKPPSEYIELAGGNRQIERPDCWIKPDDSVVISVKAASVYPSEDFKMDVTLRFPRFKKLRTDKDWTQALSISEFNQLKERAEQERKDKSFKMDDNRRKRPSTRKRRQLTVAGNDEVLTTPYAGPETKVFDGLAFFVITEALKPVKKSKAELEQLIKANGGHILQSEKDPKTICIAERKLVKVASIIKRGERNLINPSWIFDCIKQNERDNGRSTFLLPYEPDHVFFATAEDRGVFEQNVDAYGDSYARDTTAEELERVLQAMPKMEHGYDSEVLLEQVFGDGALDEMPGWMFHGLAVGFMDVGDHNSEELEGTANSSVLAAKRIVVFTGGVVTDAMSDSHFTHVVVRGRQGAESVRPILARNFGRGKKLPRIVSVDWLHDSWREKTRLDEESKFSALVECGVLLINLAEYVPV